MLVPEYQIPAAMYRGQSRLQQLSSNQRLVKDENYSLQITKFTCRLDPSALSGKRFIRGVILGRLFPAVSEGIVAFSGGASNRKLGAPSQWEAQKNADSEG